MIVPFTAVKGIDCGVCGIALDAPYPLNPGQPKTVTDTSARVRHYPKRGFTAAHYYCGWGALMNQIIKAAP